MYLSKFNRLSRLLVSPFHKTFFSYTNELSHPIPDRCPEIVATAEEAVSVIKSCDTVFCSGAAATPLVLIEAMVKHAKKNDLNGISVFHMHTEGEALYTKDEYKKHFRSGSLFMGGNVRKSVAAGESDNYSIFLQDIPKVFYKKIVEPDVSLVHVSAIDQHGYCSTGTSVDCVIAALKHSKKIVAQLNKQMPRTFGDSIIHSSHFDYAIEIDSPMPSHGGKPPNEIETKIGQLIAENLIEDGATLQMGIGNIPDAVLTALHDHKNLGIHSEMFANGVVDLVEKGCVTNSEKTFHKGRIVGSFFIGDQKLYDFVNNNPFIEMLENPKTTAINSCIEVDLTGQVNSDSIGTTFFSGFGGQVDFIRGAAECFDGKGKPIIAMPSVTAKGVSKITPILKPGAGVVTTRAHVHYVVTEQGIAFLFGKNMRQRAYELINIAHPDHREALEKAAFERLKVCPSKD
uniref:Uncharacterized protein n=1 Tax=Megaselia scalaris TaxID=36166 RepID=T1GH60_MEGSC